MSDYTTQPSKSLGRSPFLGPFQSGGTGEKTRRFFFADLVLGKRLSRPVTGSSVGHGSSSGRDARLPAQFRFRPHFQFRAKATLKSDQKSAIDHALLDASQQIHFVDTVTRMTQKTSQPFGIKADMTFPQLPRLANQFPRDA